MVKERLAQIVQEALARAQELGQLKVSGNPAVEIEPPKNAEHGDLATNLAMTLAREAGIPPREVAARIVAHVRAGDELVDSVDIAGPGFINFRLKPEWMHEVLREIDSAGSGYGRSDRCSGQQVLLEFVSANPNGPITVGSGRGGVIGDTLARLYELAGAEVSREYYINDAANSTQMINFGRSLVARYLQMLGHEVAFPEDGYQGDYVSDIARKMVEEYGEKYVEADEEERLKLFTERAEKEMIAQQQADLREFGIVFDKWYSERSLHESGRVQQAISRLKDRGYTYEHEGAVWLKSSEFGDDKDRALVRSNGMPTYIAADTAYHADKFDRGFNRLINVWGPDHHGYIARTKAAVAALGYPAAKLDILIYQAVRLFSGGELVMMSKRAGDLLSLAELVREVGRDAARFFLLMRSHDTTLDFDLELAKSQSEENPVYYVQYAHARIWSILRNAEAAGVKVPAAAEADLGLLVADSEVVLMKKLADWPEEAAEAAVECQPHRLSAYATELARLFHKFYAECRVLGDDARLTGARLVLVECARKVLAGVLEAMGVSAPEQM